MILTLRVSASNRGVARSYATAQSSRQAEPTGLAWASAPRVFGSELPEQMRKVNTRCSLEVLIANG